MWQAGTRVGAQVPAESVTAAAGVAAHGALEGLLPGVQFDVAKQVSLLREGGPALGAVKRPLAWQEDGSTVNTGRVWRGFGPCVFAAVSDLGTPYRYSC